MDFLIISLLMLSPLLTRYWILHRYNTSRSSSQLVSLSILNLNEHWPILLSENVSELQSSLQHWKVSAKSCLTRKNQFFPFAISISIFFLFEKSKGKCVAFYVRANVLGLFYHSINPMHFCYFLQKKVCNMRRTAWNCQQPFEPFFQDCPCCSHCGLVICAYIPTIFATPPRLSML